MICSLKNYKGCAFRGNIIAPTIYLRCFYSFLSNKRYGYHNIA